MNILASSGFVNFIFENWALLLFAVAAVLLLLAIFFRKVRILRIIFVCVAVVIYVALAIYLAVEAATGGILNFADFAVKWLPTIIFTFFILCSTLWGMLCGLRKSLIFTLHALVAATACVIVFVTCVNLPALDKGLLSFVNLFLGGEGSLQRMLRVSTDCTGLKEVFVKWLPVILQNNDVNIMLSGSEAYIYTLADVLFRMAFASILYVAYAILNLILYVVYLIFYSERKYRRKINKKLNENKTDRGYRRRRLGGSFVGLARGIVAGVLCLSFLGTGLFIIAGRGDGDMQDADLGNDDVNTAYSLYRSINSYGKYGIFKVLNACSSPDQSPYYLFAADLVFSGELKDEEFGIDEHVVLREELSSYACFARDTMSLLLKYGGDEIKPLIQGDATQSAVDTVVSVMQQEGFRTEFTDLISEFDTQTYVINFALSFVNSAVANIDQMSFAQSVSAENRDLLKLLFTKGYLSDMLPDEREIKAVIGENSGVLFIRPYINLSRLITKDDVKLAFNIALDVMAGDMSTTKSTLGLIKQILPKVKQISLLGGDREEELNPVLGRLYCYAANRFLKSESSDGLRYDEIYEDNVEWVSEINSLVDVADAALGLYDNIYSESKQPLDMVIDIFDKNTPVYEYNSRCFDTVCDGVIKSKLVGKTLSTSKMYNVIRNGLGSVFTGIYVPAGITYETTFKSDGTLEEAGELYRVFNGLRVLGRNSDLLTLVKNFNADRDMQKFIDGVCKVTKTVDANGVSFASYITDSHLLRSVMSAALINYGSEYVYVPLKSREEDDKGNKVKLIKSEELKVLFDNLQDIADLISPVLKNPNDTQAIANLIESQTFRNVLSNSGILEGTAGKLIVKALDGNDSVVIPGGLTTSYEGWVSAPSKKGEVANLLNAIDALDIEISSLIDGAINTEELTDKVLALTADDVENCLKSSVLHYTLSDYLINKSPEYGSFKLIVPKAARLQLTDDKLNEIVKKEEIKTILSVVNGINSDNVFSKIATNKHLLTESSIIAASSAYALVNDADVNDMLSLPAKYNDAATEQALYYYNSSNPWKEEIPYLVDALDEILGVSSDPEFKFDEGNLNNKLSALLKDLGSASSINPQATRLQVCYKSEVVRNALTVKLDEVLVGQIEDNLLLSAKRGGYYTYTELESLTNGLVIFDVDIMNVNGEELTNRVKKQVLTLNDYDSRFNKTKLEVIYNSLIISGKLSRELDTVLLDSDAPEETRSPMIEPEVLKGIKGANPRYSQQELSYMINAVVNELKIDSFDDLDTVDFDNVKNGDVKEVCKSLVIRGVLTKQISDNSTLNVDHPLAYEENLHILRTPEIESLVEIVGSMDDVDNSYFEDVRLADIKKYVYDEVGATKSYLILKCISNSIKDERNLIVRQTLLDSYGCIPAAETGAFIDAFIEVEGEDVTINKWTKTDDDGESAENVDFKYPNAEQRTTVFASELLRAKITEQILEKNNTAGSTFFVGKDNVMRFADTHGRDCFVLSLRELENLCNALDLCNVGSENKFAVPQFGDMQSIVDNKENIDVFYASDIIRFRITDCILNNVTDVETMPDKQLTFNLFAKEDNVEKTCIALETIKQTI